MRRLLASTGLSQADLMSLSRGKLFDDRDETAGGFVAQPCPRLSDDEGYFINLDYGISWRNMSGVNGAGT